MGYSQIESQTGSILNDLYRTHHINAFDTYLFIADLFNNEIAQFITEYHNKSIRFFLYHTDTDATKQQVEDFGKVCKHFSWDGKYETTKIPNNIINNDLYNNKQTILKENFCTYFLSNDVEIPQSLASVLYPNSNLPIKMFDNANIKHYQNLGMLNEYDKANILKQAKYHIDNNGFYSLEAVACGCDLISIDNIKDNDNNFIVDKHGSKKLKKSLKNTYTYRQFIEEHIL
jgi:hypothetical protein